MMLLSRFWYVLLSVLLGVALYVVYVAVGQYNRRNLAAMGEGLASDSQTVGWALQIDARRRLDLLLPGSVDPNVRSALTNANGKDKVPPKSREDAKKALSDIQSKFADYKPDAIFAVDRDGRVVAEVGYDAVSAKDEFELGGYPAVFDALHGYLRDDTWVWGGKIFRVVARPVEDDSTQPPVGAIVAIRAVDPQFARELAKRTRTNLAFYASNQKVAAAAYEGAGEKFDETSFELLTQDLPKVLDDKSYKESGRSDVRLVGPDGNGAMYARLPGDAWELGAGFTVMRPRIAIKGPMGFLSGADDTDKKSVSWLVIVAVVFLSALVGLGFSFLEHTMPMGELARQARRLKKGEQDYFQLPKFRGGYRPIAQDVNQGIERVAERGGAAVRKPADLESILGPVPAQPAMSAFSFPMANEGPGAAAPPPMPSSPQAMGQGPGASPGPAGGASPFRAPGPPQPPHAQGRQMPPPISPGARPDHGGPPGPPGQHGPAHGPGQNNFGMNAGPPRPNAPQHGAPPFPPPRGPNAGMPPTSPFAQTTALGGPPSSPGAGGHGAPNFGHPADAYEPTQAAASAALAQPQITPLDGPQEEDEATMVGQVPADVLAAASGENKVEDGTEEWLGVYDDFIRKKRECNEPTDGLTFEKFAQTLRKNRDALMQRHGCKRVRFAVYVKEGRASLKATPIKD